MADISKLIDLVPPPASPIEVGTVDDWRRVCSEMNQELPDDLREFSMRYGSGRFDKNELRFFNPFAPGYKSAMEAICRRLKESMEPRSMLIDPSYGVFPDAGGLFPLGRNGGGYELYWITKGKPDKWQIISLVPAYEDETEIWKMPLIEFMTKLFSNKIKSRMDSEPFTKANLKFVPESK